MILFLLDENTPENIAEFLHKRGHQVRRVRDDIPGASDEQVAAHGNRLGAILVTWNAKHFRRLAARRAAGRMRYRNLGRLCFNCPEARGLERIERFIETIEYEYAQVTAPSG
jgi:hypothetical protein